MVTVRTDIHLKNAKRFTSRFIRFATLWCFKSVIRWHWACVGEISNHLKRATSIVTVRIFRFDVWVGEYNIHTPTEDRIELFSDSQTKVKSLSDPETNLPYAIRIKLTTTTSQTVETVLLPLDEIEWFIVLDFVRMLRWYKDHFNISFNRLSSIHFFLIFFFYCEILQNLISYCLFYKESNSLVNLVPWSNINPHASDYFR